MNYMVKGEALGPARGVMNCYLLPGSKPAVHPPHVWKGLACPGYPRVPLTPAG